MSSYILADVVLRVQDALRNGAGILGGCTKNVLPPGSDTGSKVGDYVNVEIQPFLSASDVTPAITPPALGSTTYKGKQVALSAFKEVCFDLTSREWATLKDPTSTASMTIQAAIDALLVPVRTAVFAKLKTGLMGYRKSAAGTSFFNSTDKLANFSQAVGILDKQACPKDRVAVLANTEVATARGLQDFSSALYAPQGQADAVYGTGLLGTLFGAKLLQEDGIVDIPATHTAGTASVTTWTLSSTHAAGSTSISVTGGTGTILEGDIVTIGNYEYVVKTTLSGATVVLNEPGLLESVAAASNVTIKDGSSTHSIRGYVFCPRGVLLALRTPMVPGEDGNPIVVVDPVTGIPVKLCQYAGYHAAKWGVSLLYGADTSDARMGARLVV